MRFVSIPHWFDQKRVRALWVQVGETGLRGFNSTLVRLEGAAGAAGAGRRTRFQFHTGSIRSYLAGHANIPTHNCFNSTLVRLEVASVHSSGNDFPSFNSTLVRLEGVLTVCWRRVGLCFNSTLVRLEDRGFLLFRQGASLFQFHTGSIRRGCSFSAAGTALLCFNSTLVRLEACASTAAISRSRRFQFHTGSIRRRLLLPQFLWRLIMVSIPHWFD